MSRFQRPKLRMVLLIDVCSVQIKVVPILLIDVCSVQTKGVPMYITRWLAIVGCGYTKCDA